MESLPHELGPIRPVDEADSLLIRATRGCPWNKCEFCVNYTLGKRLGYYRNMDDMQDENRKMFVQRKVSKIMDTYPGQFDEICHHLRAQVV